jgi:hypothetical protein
MSVTCSVYGLGLSINVPLAGLRGLAPAGQIDVTIEVGDLPREALAGQPGAIPFHSSDEIDEHGTPVRRVARSRDGDFFHIDYCDGTRVVLNASGQRVWARGATPDLEDTATYVLGPVLGMVLRLRGVNCLHASAVAIGNSACAFVGRSGSGKSSIAAAFARRGHAVLSDDVTAVEERDTGFVAQPAYPRLRLWPESVEGLFGAADSLPRMVEGWDKRYVDLASAPFRFQRAPLPLAAIYLLDSGPGEPAIATVGSREAVMGLVAETFATYLLDRDMRAREFDFIGRMIEAVPVRRLRRGVGWDDLGLACDLVVADAASRSHA